MRQDVTQCWHFIPIGFARGYAFLVPVAFAVTVPAEALTQRLTHQTLIGAIAFATFLLIVSRLFWRRGSRQYGGASA